MKKIRDKEVGHKRGRPRQFDRHKAMRDALELFWTQGYMQTTTAQLCKVMGINSPSLYCAFGSKADLFLEALTYYRHTYWQEAFKNYLQEPNIYKGTKILFLEAARILLLPSAPCGCMTVYSALTLPAKEKKILETISLMREDTKNMFRTRLMNAIKTSQIPVDSDIPAIAGALTNYFEGLTLQARDNLCLLELQKIAERGVFLLPIQSKIEEI